MRVNICIFLADIKKYAHTSSILKKKAKKGAKEYLQKQSSNCPAISVYAERAVNLSMFNSFAS